MNSIAIVVISSLVSGLVATLITLWVQHRSMLRSEKRKILHTLMEYRYAIAAQESVKALNSIDVVFYKDVEVRRAYKNFLDETDRAAGQTININIEDKHIKLLEEIAKSIGFRSLNWDTIKHYYYPKGLADKINSEDLLKQVQIEVGMKSLENTADKADRISV